VTRLVRFGGWLTVAGVVAFVVSLFGDATAACTAAESMGEQTGEFRLLEIGADGITYTPDSGVNTCTMGLAYVTLHGGLLAAALGSASVVLGVLVRKVTKNRSQGLCPLASEPDLYLRSARCSLMSRSSCSAFCSFRRSSASSSQFSMTVSTSLSRVTASSSTS